jgi:hypothetical protein
MSHIQGGRSSSHVEWPYYDDDIPRKHDYFHGDFKSHYMPIGPTDTFVLQLLDRHWSNDVFVGIIKIFNVNKFFHYLTLHVLYIYVIIF